MTEQEQTPAEEDRQKRTGQEEEAAEQTRNRRRKKRRRRTMQEEERKKQQQEYQTVTEYKRTVYMITPAAMERIRSSSTTQAEAAKMLGYTPGRLSAILHNGATYQVLSRVLGVYGIDPGEGMQIRIPGYQDKPGREAEGSRRDGAEEEGSGTEEERIRLMMMIGKLTPEQIRSVRDYVGYLLSRGV